MLRLFLFSAAVFVTLIHPPGRAAAQEITPVSETGAAALADALSSGIQKWFPETTTSPSYSWEGTISVTPAGDAYEVQLPTLMVVPEQAGAWVIDGISLSIVPHKDDAYAVSATLPSEIPFVQPDGSVTRSAEIGSQTFSGVWRTQADALTDINATFSDIILGGANLPISTRLGTIDVFTQLSPESNGRWSGPSTLRLENLLMAGPNEQEIFRLDHAAFEGEISGLDLQQQASLAGGAGGSSLQARLSALRGLLDGASGILSLSRLSAHSPLEDSRFGLDGLSAEIVIQGLVSNASTVSVGYSHSGLTLDPPATGEDFLPHHVAFRLTALDLPNAALTGALDRFLARRGANAGPAATISFVQEIMRSLTAAAATFRFEEFTIDTPATSTHAEGYTRFNAQALLGAVAEFDISIRGLDQALAALQPKPGESLASDAQNTLALLGLLQVMGLPGQDKQGRPTREYNIEVRPNGSATLNSADLGSLLRSIQNQ